MSADTYAEPVSARVAAELDRLRRKVDLTQAEMARGARLHQPKVSSHLSGRMTIPLSALRKYAALFHTTVEALDPHGDYKRKRLSPPRGPGDVKEVSQMSELPKTTRFFGQVIAAWNALDTDEERWQFGLRCQAFAQEARRRKNA